MTKREAGLMLEKIATNRIGNVSGITEEMREAIFMGSYSLMENKPNEWCHGCKEYSKRQHCCPRFGNVIRSTLDEIQKYAREDGIKI